MRHDPLMHAFTIYEERTSRTPVLVVGDVLLQQIITYAVLLVGAVRVDADRVVDNHLIVLFFRKKLTQATQDMST